MTKQELIKKIEQHFGKGTKFFKWLGYKNPSQSWYSFIKSKNETKSINVCFEKLIKLYEDNLTKKQIMEIFLKEISSDIF